MTREKAEPRSPRLRNGSRTAQRGTRLAALVFALVGCGSAKEEEPEKPDPAPQEYATFVDLYADMVCGLVSRCCNEVNQALYTLSGEETCEDAVELTTGTTQIGVLGALGTDSATYDEPRQRACAAALEAATCEELETGTPPACEEPWFEGTVALGQECTSSAECIEGYCIEEARARREPKDLIGFLLFPPDPPKMICVVPLPVGADCTDDAQCESFSCEDDVCEATPTTLDAMCPI
jgi:hypothetical protein